MNKSQLTKWVSFVFGLGVFIYFIMGCTSSADSNQSSMASEYQYLIQSDEHLELGLQQGWWTFSWSEEQVESGQVLQGQLISPWGNFISESSGGQGDSRSFAIIFREPLGQDKISFLEITLPNETLTVGDVPVTVRAENNAGLIYVRTFFAHLLQTPE